jgi:hypothetical protein
MELAGSSYRKPHFIPRESGVMHKEMEGLIDLAAKGTEGG